MKIKVYSKLSIDANSVRRILPRAVVSGPIERSQLLADIDQNYNVIAIIDGAFDQSLAVSPSEIMDALRSGVRVYGSSSMGALRAAETAGYGMIGYGEIFNLILAAPNFRDDFLGQVFQKNTQRYQSYTYVDFYFSVRSLVSRGLIQEKLGHRLCSNYEELYYAQRNLEALRHKMSGESDFGKIDKAIQQISENRFSQKREDAIGLLKLIKRDLFEIGKTNLKLARDSKRAPDPFSFFPRDFYK